MNWRTDVENAPKGEPVLFFCRGEEPEYNVAKWNQYKDYWFVVLPDWDDFAKLRNPTMWAEISQ